MTLSEWESIYDRVFDIKQDADEFARSESFGECASRFQMLYSDIKCFLFDLEATAPMEEDE